MLDRNSVLRRNKAKAELGSTSIREFQKAGYSSLRLWLLVFGGNGGTLPGLYSGDWWLSFGNRYGFFGPRNGP